jgi:hypothetical protein
VSGRCQQCPKCKALYSATKSGRPGNCTACLMERADMVQLDTVYHDDTVAERKATE